MDYEKIEILVLHAKEKDNLSKEMLVEEFKPFIINLSSKTFISGYDSEDIQNECYKSLFKCVSLYSLEKHRFVAYATNGIKNNLYDLIRKSKNRSASEGMEALTLSDNLEHTLPSLESSLDEMLCTKSDYELLRSAFDKLTPEEKELILFVYFKNNSLQTYAYWKNLCYSTANKRKKSILKKLKNKIFL